MSTEHAEPSRGALDALKLGLSPHSVHQYVKQLYAQLEVNSRGELLAQWVGKF